MRQRMWFAEIPVVTHSWGRRLLFALLGCLSLLSVAAGDEYPELRALLEQGRLDAARNQVTTLLARRPDDPMLRFTRAVIAEQEGNKRMAMDIYASLNRTHPALLEPYNNLAILYADAGDYKSAVTTLENALKSNAAVATTYGNLTAIYTRLASAAYGKALDAPTPLAPLELASLTQLGPQPGIAACGQSQQ
jgi:tetratricopeptide (TPR) repeat protein